MHPARLPIPAAPARHESLASYLSRLANLHGMPTSELWEPISAPRPGTKRRDVLPDALAALVGRTRGQLARALPELHPNLDWTAWRHRSQPGCPRCDARHDGGPVARLLPHYHYVCTRHRYWIGPPDAGQPATELEPGPVEFDEIVRAQRRHQRILRRHGSAAAFDAVLTGFLICGHLWDDSVGHWDQTVTRWDGRAGVLIPKNAEHAQFSASRIFAAVYPEVVEIAALIAEPGWRRLAAGTEEQQQRFVREIGARLGRPDYRPPEHGDAITHWMKFDSWRPPSGPETTFPQTREHGSSVRPRHARTASSETTAARSGSRSNAMAAASSFITDTFAQSWYATGHRRWTASRPPSGEPAPQRTFTTGRPHDSASRRKRPRSS
jgi:hypothetical protein